MMNTLPDILMQKQNLIDESDEVEEKISESAVVEQIERNRNAGSNCRTRRAKKHVKFLKEKIRDYKNKQHGIDFLKALNEKKEIPVDRSSQAANFKSISTHSQHIATLRGIQEMVGMESSESETESFDFDEEERQESLKWGASNAQDSLLHFHHWTSGSPMYGTTNQQKTKQEQKKSAGARKNKHGSQRRFCWCLESNIFAVINLGTISNGLCEITFRSSITFVAIPATIGAVFLFYCLDNPSMPFHETGTISWWLLFFARQSVMLELARVLEYCIMNGVMLKTSGIVKILGPFVTLFAIQSSGWPFILTLWSICDLIFLHGSNRFQQNWFSFTELMVFSPANEGGRILIDKTYLRILIAGFLAGIAHSVKRFLVATYFGKRTLSMYRVRLKQLMSDVILVAEISQLANELGSPIRRDSPTIKLERLRSIGTNFRRGVTADSERELSDDNESDGGEMCESSDDDNDCNADLTDSVSYLSGEIKSSRSSIRISSVGKLKPKRSYRPTKPKTIQDHFDLVEEQPGGQAAMAEPTILDILNFQKALKHLDDDFPFTEPFGPVKTRAQCIKGSENCFTKLSKFNEEGVHPLLGNKVYVIPFETLALIATDDNDIVAEYKLRALKALFTPDKDNEVTELTFVRSIDTVYKRLLFFRASVTNFSKIDDMLEGLVNIIFHSLVCFLLMLLLNFNPYPLLVSISTVTVSFAFAFGASVSKYIEGILLIAVRRPYDLGDRILISSADTSPPVSDTDMQNAASLAWIVEDINLFQTRLRFVPTNEVASISNGSIAMARIVNFARSPNALITLYFQFTKNASRETIAIFYTHLERFVRDRPSQWDRILSFQLIKIHSTHLQYQLRLRHKRGWQEAQFVSTSKAEMLDLCDDAMKMLMIEWDSRTLRVAIEGNLTSEDD